MSRKKTFYALSIIALAVVIFGLAWAEQMTLTTYYPAPYGIYKEFTTTSKTTLAINTTDPEAKVGIGTTIPTEKLYVSGKIYATADVCIVEDSEEQICLSYEEGGGWRYSGEPIYTNETLPSIWTPIDLSRWVGNNYALVVLKISYAGDDDSPEAQIVIRPKDDPELAYPTSLKHAYGTGEVELNHTNNAGILVTETDASGYIDWKCKDASHNGPVDMQLLGYIK